MGLREFFNKPDPQEEKFILTEAIKKAGAYTAKGEHDVALQALVEHKKIGWKYHTYLLHLAMAYFQADHKAEAIECYERAIELNPNNGIGYTNLGYVYFCMRDYKNAVIQYGKGIRLIEAKPDSYARNDYLIACAWYGASLAGTGNKTDGEFYLKKAEAGGYQKADALREIVGLTPSPKQTSANTEEPQKKDLIQELAELILRMIPEQWSEIYFYGEVLSDSRQAYFFYRRLSDNELIYIHDIRKYFPVPDSVQSKRHDDIIHCLEELNKEEASKSGNAWTNMTLVLDKSGKFHIKYDYEDILNSGFYNTERQKIWMYEVIGIEPKNEEDKELIRRYQEKQNASKEKQN